MTRNLLAHAARAIEFAHGIFFYILAANGRFPPRPAVRKVRLAMVSAEVRFQERSQ